MIFISGLETRQRELGPGELETCLQCQEEKYQLVEEDYQSLSFFFLPVWRFARRLFLRCPQCQNRQETAKVDRGYYYNLVTLNKMFLNELIEESEYLWRFKLLKKPSEEGSI